MHDLLETVMTKELVTCIFFLAILLRMPEI